MGGSVSRTESGLDAARKRAEDRGGKLAVSGRYYRLPKRIEDDYNVDKKKVLGSGYNGEVFLAEDKTTGKKYAIKGFHLHGIKKEKMKELESEAEIFLSMDHPHVARLAGVYECDKQLNLVMECMEGGELFDRVMKLKRFSEKDAAHAAWQMLLAINYIHGKGIVHRDLKLENFLYESETSEHLKLIDFGFSKVWDVNTRMELSCGTLAYVAPEVLQRSYTNKCDLWSLGVIVFILLVGYMPFNGSEDNTVKCIREGRPKKDPKKWEKVSKPAQELVFQKLLQVDAEKRYSAAQALEHPWIAQRELMRAESTVSGVDESIVTAFQTFAEASQFRRACLSVMAWSLTNEERAKVRDTFIQMDVDNTGTVKLWEFKKVMKEKFSFGDEKLEDMFSKIDTADNEEIHYTEFLAAMVSTRIKMHDDLLASTFKKFDVDNSGFITKENLREVLGAEFDGEEIEKLMSEADLTNDGQISYEEFIAYLKDGQVNENQMAAAEKLVDSAAKREKQAGGSSATGRKEIQMKERRMSAEQPQKSGSNNQAASAGSDSTAKGSKSCTLL